LLSVRGGGDVEDEAAIWSAETGFATVLVGILETWFDRHLGDGTER